MISYIAVSHRELRDQVKDDDSWLRSLRAALVAVEPVHKPLDLGNGVKLLLQCRDDEVVRIEVDTSRS